MNAQEPPAPPPDDALEHLWNAAHEFLRAMRSLVDAADEFVEHQRTAKPARDAHEPRVQHINISVDDDNMSVENDADPA